MGCRRCLILQSDTVGASSYIATVQLSDKDLAH